MFLHACVGSLVACASQGVGEPTREAQVLELVRRLERETMHAWWYESTGFRRLAGDSDGSSERWVPSIPIDCGNSDGGDFDDRVAMHFGLELCRVFGVQAEPGLVVEATDARAVLDGADVRSRIGFVLRGIPGYGMGATTLPEDPRTDLSAEEARILADAGWRIFVANVSEYPLMDSDQFTPTLAFLGGLAEHLDRVTDGDDVDLAGLLFAKTLCLRLPEIRFQGPAARTVLDGRYIRLEVKEPTTVQLAFPGREGGPAAGPEFPASTRGAPSVVCFEAMRDAGNGGSSPPDRHWPSPFAALRVLQTSADGRALRCETLSARIFLPGEYDLSRPFTVELDLAPGKYAIPDSVRLGASDRVGS
jgi:hypothetical protein